MEITQLKNLIAENIDIIASIDGYKSILNRNNGLYRFDVLNRLLISIQSNTSIDIKTDEEWLLFGRKVKDNQRPIFIIMPKITSCYVDNDTKEPINLKEFTPDELNNAIKYNIVSKVENLETLYTMPVYDVRQTIGVNGNNYDYTKPILKSKYLFELLIGITGCTIELSDETYYSKSNNTLYVSKQPYKKLLDTITDILVTYMIDNGIERALSNTTDFSIKDLSEYDLDLLKISLAYTIKSLHGVNFDYDFDYIRHTSIDKIISILSIVDYFAIEVIANMKYNNSGSANDAVASIRNIKKADVLLDVMEANIINKKMKGI